jgi:hypothetical protein
MAKSRKRDSSVIDQSSTTQSPVANGRDPHPYDRDRVARRAYELYLARGGSHGSDWDDWLAAERELMHAPEREQRRGAGKDR